MSATAESGTAAPLFAGTFSTSMSRRSPRTLSGSCTRIGTWRSPASNLARFAPTSPIVPTRTVSAITSVETPSSAASAGFGRMRISGRSSGAVETTFTSVGIVAISRCSFAAVSITTSWSGPPTMSCKPRWPLSLSTKKRMSGHLAEIVDDAAFELPLAQGALAPSARSSR